MRAIVRRPVPENTPAGSHSARSFLYFARSTATPSSNQQPVSERLTGFVGHEARLNQVSLPGAAGR